MEKCKYVFTNYPVRVGELVQSGYPTPCVVALSTVVYTSKATVVGPCSPSSVSSCVPPSDSDSIVWLAYGNKRLVFRRHVLDRVFKVVNIAFSIGRPFFVLLAGASGTGKTTLGEMILRVLGLPGRVRSATEALSKYVGESEKMVRDMVYECASEGGVIDEFDGLLPVGRGGEQLEESVKTRNAFLTAVDRAKSEVRKPSVVFATTNVDVSAIPEEVLRRFDAVIEFPKPTRDEYELFIRLNGGDTSLLPLAVSLMVPYSDLDRCIKFGMCDFERDFIVVYAEAYVRGASKDRVEEIVSAVDRKLAIYIEAECSKDPVCKEYILLSALLRKPIIVTRTVDEYYKWLATGKYYDAVLAPFPDSVSKQDVVAAIGKLPVLSPYRDVAKVSVTKQFFSSLDTDPPLQQLKDEVEARVYRLARTATNVAPAIANQARSARTSLPYK